MPAGEALAGSAGHHPERCSHDVGTSLVRVGATLGSIISDAADEGGRVGEFLSAFPSYPWQLAFLPFLGVGAIILLRFFYLELERRRAEVVPGAAPQAPQLPDADVDEGDASVGEAELPDPFRRRRPPGLDDRAEPVALAVGAVATSFAATPPASTAAATGVAATTGWTAPAALDGAIDGQSGGFDHGVATLRDVGVEHIVVVAGTAGQDVGQRVAREGVAERSPDHVLELQLAIINEGNKVRLLILLG